MHETKRMKGYITYPMEIKIRAILLDKYNMNCVKITMDGKEYESDKPIDETLLKDMISRGAKIERFEKDTYHGKKCVFNIRDTNSQSISIDGSKFIRIRVIGDNLDDLMEKISAIKKKMLMYGVQPKVCVWNKVGKVVTRPIPQESPKNVPNVDFEDIKRRRDLELKTSRQK